MDLNPYAGWLGRADAMTVVEQTPGHLGALLASMPGDAAEQPRAPGKWSAREIVAHLADCEMVFSFRLRQTLSSDGPVIQPFDQGVWAERYAGYDLASGMALFCAAREWNRLLLRHMTDAEWGRVVTHPERGVMTLRTIVETMAGHDLNHLQQIEEIADGAGNGSRAGQAPMGAPPDA